MGSLWKREKSPYWVCCYTGPDGRRLKKSTKLTDRKKALRVCIEWEEAASKAKHGLLTEAQARKIVSEIVEISTGESIEFYTIEEWLTHWLEIKGESRETRTHERYQAVIKSFLKYLNGRVSLNLSHLSSKDIKGFRDEQRKAGKKAKTCNFDVKTIGTALNAAKRLGLIEVNVVEAIESLPVETVEKQIFSIEQLSIILEIAKGDWHGAILMGYFTGARLRDVTNMRWSSVDLSCKAISFVAQKTKRTSKKKIVIPLHPQLEKHLLSLPTAETPDEFIFKSLSEKKTSGARGLSRQFIHILSEAGFNKDEDATKEGKGRRVSKLSFHSLRHTFNSALANNGVSQEIRQKLVGHASPEMNEVYTHLKDGLLHDAISVIPRV